MRNSASKLTTNSVTIKVTARAITNKQYAAIPTLTISAVTANIALTKVETATILAIAKVAAASAETANNNAG